MAIKYNDANISAIDYGSTEINTVTYNGTVVFSKLVNYTFPNRNAKMKSQTSYGINVDHDTSNGSSYHAYNAFDNNLETGFMAYNTKDKTVGKIIITFPFKIQVQSIIIKNPSKALGSSGTIGGLKTGGIYISTTVKDKTFDDTGTTSYKYADLNRSNASTASYSTTHTNATYATTNIRSICIRGTSWGSSGTSSWHQIGEIYINFNASSSDLNNWKSTYGISS